MTSGLAAALMAVLLSAMMGAADAEAAMHALVIGVNAYAHKQHLFGSVNDAEDISHVLKEDGVVDVTTLTDGQATKHAFVTDWTAMVSRTHPGDVLFFSFSGHGIRVPEKTGQHHTPDGYEKGFLLQPYDEEAAPEQLLRDESLYDLFAAATAKGLKIIFIADACHSGSAVRGVDARSSGVHFRFQRFQTEAAPIAPPPPSQVKARPPNPDVTIFSATDKRLTIQEILIDGRYRGALSYAVSRGLEGAASDTKGVVTVAALHRFVAPLVRVLSGNRQIPQFALPEPKLDLVRVAGSSTTAFSALPTLRLAVMGKEPDAGTKFAGAKLTADRSAADLIWDSGRKQLISSGGDVLASGIDAGALQDGVDSRRVLDALKRIMAHQYGPVETIASVNGGKVQAGAFVTHGMTVRFTVHPGDFNYITMLDLNATGTLQFMWPLSQLGDQAEWTSPAPLSFTSPVTPPYGADFVISLLSREPLSRLHAVLEKTHNTAAPLDFYRAFLAARQRTEVRIGIEGIYSCKQIRSNGQCVSQLSSPL